MTRLVNKVAIVTGGTKGIGFAIAEELLRSGAVVFICGRDETDLKLAVEKLSLAGGVAGAACDVRDEAQVKAMLAECIQTFGGQARNFGKHSKQIYSVSSMRVITRCP
jgi:NAD(P)-dependent dehydrogenase (short-subunit alcohol dehydrogenase family)